MFKRKLDFEKDSVVPSSSYMTLGAAVAFAAYGLMQPKPIKGEARGGVSAIDAGKFNAIDKKIGEVDGALTAAKKEIGTLKKELLGC